MAQHYFVSLSLIHQEIELCLMVMDLQNSVATSQPALQTRVTVNLWCLDGSHLTSKSYAPQTGLITQNYSQICIACLLRILFVNLLTHFLGHSYGLCEG